MLISSKKIEYIKPLLSEKMIRDFSVASRLRSVLQNFSKRFTARFEIDMAFKLKKSPSDAYDKALIRGLMSVEQSAFFSKNRNLFKNLKYVLSMDEHILLVAKAGGRIVGFQLGYPLNDPAGFYFARNAISEDFQFKGLSRPMVHLFLALVRDEGFKMIYAHAGVKSKQGADLVKYYQKLGFFNEDDGGPLVKYLNPNISSAL